MSIQILARGNDDLVVATDTIHRIDSSTLQNSGQIILESEEGQLVRSLFSRNKDLCWSNTTTFCADTPVLSTPIAAAFANGDLVGAAYWGPGLYFQDGEKTHTFADAPAFRQLIPSVDRQLVYGVTSNGLVYEIEPNQTFKEIPFAKVNLLLPTVNGLISVRGYEVWLNDTHLFTGDTVPRRLTADGRFVVTGDAFGGVRVYNIKGHLLAQLDAHKERISALAIQRDWLLGADAQALGPVCSRPVAARSCERKPVPIPQSVFITLSQI